MIQETQNNINDGGPAFACAAENGHQPGMSLRDYFAGQALIATTPLNFTQSFEDVAKDAYFIADAMLKAREVKP